MTDTPPSNDPAPAQPTAMTASYTCHVLPGAAFTVTSGANLGDALGGFDELCAGDTYRLEVKAEALQLAVADASSGTGRILAAGTKGHHVAEGSEIGTTGTPLHLAGRLTLLAPEGHKVELLLIDITPDSGDSLIAALPLEPIEPGRDHTLIGLDENPGEVRLADVSTVAFARGTDITLADGRQCKVEDLSVGDRILTRDHGPQPLVWLFKRTIRAVGPYAPVVIPADTLGNAGDLIVSQHQRLFIYQRDHDRLTETAEMLVRAAYLADEDNVYIRPGGFTDFYSLVFEHHEVIYAECIPVESLQVNESTLASLPEEVAQDFGSRFPSLSHKPHFGTDANKRTARAARKKLWREKDDD